MTATFKTRDDAQAFVDRLDSRTYYLNHGEHSRPNYQVRKIRGREGFEIFARYHYYSGTFNTPQNRPIGADFVEWIKEGL